MDFKNENSKIYLLPTVVSIFGIILSIGYFIVGDSNEMSRKLLSMSFLCISISYSLIGTQKVYAKNNKKGYFDYLFTLIYFILTSYKYKFSIYINLVLN